MGYAFAVVEKLLQETFLPRLFLVKYKSLPPIVVTLSTMEIKKSGIGLQYPITSVNEKYLSLMCANKNLIGAVTGERAISTTDHLMALR